MEEKNKEHKTRFIILAFGILICFVAIGYAAWTKVYNGEKENSIDTATLILTLDESESNEISLLNTVPVSDATGLTYRPYTFKLKNSGTIKANYRLKIIDYEKFIHCVLPVYLAITSFERRNGSRFPRGRS